MGFMWKKATEKKTVQQYGINIHYFGESGRILVLYTPNYANELISWLVQSTNLNGMSVDMCACVCVGVAVWIYLLDMGHFGKHSIAYSFDRRQWIPMGMLRIEHLRLYHSIQLLCRGRDERKKIVCETHKKNVVSVNQGCNAPLAKTEWLKNRISLTGSMADHCM